MAEFVRPHHRTVARVLERLNGDLLARARCYFGGGTQLAMAFGEYRESRDIDFMCANREGYALLRGEITDQSLGAIARGPITLAREVRADRDGIRTFVDIDDMRIKFEILLEARIDLDGEMNPALGVPMLTNEYAIAEKLLANTDRGLDHSTLARDLIDLAFAMNYVGTAEFEAGLRIAEQVYGTAVRRTLADTIAQFSNDRRRAAHCIEQLAIEESATLRKGLRTLGKLLESV